MGVGVDNLGHQMEDGNRGTSRGRVKVGNARARIQRVLNIAKGYGWIDIRSLGLGWDGVGFCTRCHGRTEWRWWCSGGHGQRLLIPREVGLVLALILPLLDCHHKTEPARGRTRHHPAVVIVVRLLWCSLPIPPLVARVARGW